MLGNHKASRLILASASPRRHELLSYLVSGFSVQAADIDETPTSNEPPEQLVQRLAEQKAQAIYAQRQAGIVIGADTIVTLNNQIFGKPQNQNDSISMLSTLSGRSHIVMTAVAMKSEEKSLAIVVKTHVEFAHLSIEDIKYYWHSGEPQDKAGSYAIQGIGGKFVVSITGSYSSVVGLPLAETRSMLSEMGMGE